MRKVSSRERKIVVIFVLFCFAVISWLRYFNSTEPYSSLALAQEGKGPFGAIGAFQLFFQLIIWVAVTNVFELTGKIGRAFTYSVAVILLVLIASYSATGTLIGFTNLDIWEPIFVCFMFFSAVVFQFKLIPGITNETET